MKMFWDSLDLENGSHLLRKQTYLIENYSSGNPRFERFEVSDEINCALGKQKRKVNSTWAFFKTRSLYRKFTKTALALLPGSLSKTWSKAARVRGCSARQYAVWILAARKLVGKRAYHQNIKLNNTFTRVWGAKTKQIYRLPLHTND